MKKISLIIIMMIIISSCSNIKEYNDSNNSTIYDGQQEIKSSKIKINSSVFE